jgi:diguanylate cyclase (GGDEF)-like protein
LFKILPDIATRPTQMQRKIGDPRQGAPRVECGNRSIPMMLDLATLLAVTVFTAMVGGCLLLLSWVQHRNVGALALWSIGFFMGAAGTALIAGRGAIPDIWSIFVANAIIAGGYGMIWAGAREFGGRRPIVSVMLAGVLIWLLACQFEVFYTTPRARIALMSTVVGAYSLLSAWEFWRGRGAGQLSRWLVVLLLCAHAAVFLVRIPLDRTMPIPLSPHDVHADWFTFLAFEGIFISFCVAYLFGSMARERVVLAYKRASMMDPLTGVANRRAFFVRGRRLVRRGIIDRRPAVLMVFDIDRFKEINDTFGHQAGDEVLRAFCRVATSILRPNDLFARLGGEEFACIVPQSSPSDAAQIAERIRRGFQATPLEVGGNRLNATVSIGVTMTGGRATDLSGLIAEADQALYRAKEAGRNRVEITAGSPLPPGRPPAAAGGPTGRLQVMII